MELTRDQRSQWANEFRKSPAFMKLFLEKIFMEIKTDADRGVHNKYVEYITSICSDRAKLIEKVSNTIINLMETT